MVSVVIPAYNEEKSISNTLDAFLHQTTKEKFEVIVVDNNSTDKTVDIVNAYKNKLDLRLISEKKKGRGAARFCGFKAATGEIILSTDSDAVVSNNWIENLVSNLKKSSAVAVTGSCRINDCDFVTNTIFNFVQPRFMSFYKLFLGHYWLSGYNFGVYKKIYKKSGGFDRNLNAQEDIDISFKVAKLGKIKYIPSATVLFSGRRFKGGFLKGTLPYVSTYISYVLFKKDISLPDIR